MNEIPSSECVNSPIISKTPGSTRIFNRSESRYNKRNVTKPCDVANNGGTLTVVSDSEESAQSKIGYCLRKTVLRKRAFLLLLGFLYFVSVEHTHHYVYFPIIIFAVSFVVFYNFPLLVYCSNSKPLYYEDLFIDTSKLPLLDLDPNIRKRFENSFELTLVVTNSFLLAGMSDYWIYKTVNHDTFIEIVGITGGILQIFQIVNNILGSLLLSYFSMKIHKTVKKRKLSREKMKNKKKMKNRKLLWRNGIEMVKLGDTRHEVYDNRSLERFALEEKVLAVEEGKKIVRNYRLAQFKPFKRVGRKKKDSPHPLKNLETESEAKKMENRKSENRKSENRKSENRKIENDKNDFVVIDVERAPSPVSDIEIDTTNE